MIKFIKGNLFDTDAQIICHQCNCYGVMGSGVAKEVKQRYPNVFKDYRNDYENGKLKLGYVCFSPTENCKGQIIANMCGQNYYGFQANNIQITINYKSVLIRLLNMQKTSIIQQNLKLPFRIV